MARLRDARDVIRECHLIHVLVLLHVEDRLARLALVSRHLVLVIHASCVY